MRRVAYCTDKSLTTKALRAGLMLLKLEVGTVMSCRFLNADSHSAIQSAIVMHHP